MKSGNILEFLKILKDRPVTIAFHVSNAFNYLSYGQIVDWNDSSICPLDGEPNHAVLAVAYSIDVQNGGKNYVKFKNSWGMNWGTDGYFKLGIRDELPIILSDSEKNNSTC